MISWVGKLARSFACAFAGLWFLIREERNMRLHLLAAALTIAAGGFFHVSRIEWCLLLVCIGAVLGAEALNSALEHLCDRVTSEREEPIRRIKDAAAAGVLILSICAALVGAVIFWPHVAGLMGR